MKRALPLTLCRCLPSLILFFVAGSVAGSDPLRLKSPTDSVRVIFGDFDQWVLFATDKAVDTSHLNMKHDLILLSATDSLFVARSETPVTVQFEIPSGMRTEVFMFKIPIDTTKVAFLRQYCRFTQDSNSSAMSFSYRRSSDSVLAELRTRFNLDSIAGSGQETEQIVRLLGWVHTTIRHDGNQEGPSGSTVEKIQKAIAEQATMNCGGLAHTLADVYAAERFTARTIVAMPYDTADYECHQVTEVWSNALSKWLFMDPTNNAYFMNGRGDLLQIDEVRQELAMGDPARRDEFIRINDDINWNGEPYEKERYLHYMAKNLFRFRTWGYLQSDSTKLWTIELVPDGYEIFPIGTIRDENGVVTFRTHDISLLWESPSTAKVK